jgi:hypothetical protein
MDLLDTYSCRGTVPMEPPMSNRSMQHQNPDLDFDDTGHFLQGALCTIAAVCHTMDQPDHVICMYVCVGTVSHPYELTDLLVVV